MKEKQLHIRLTKEDYDEIKERSQKANLTMTDYILKSVLNKEILFNMIYANGFELEKNSDVLEFFSRQNIQEAKKAVLVACSEANKLKSKVVRKRYFAEFLKEEKTKNAMEELQILVGLSKVKTTLNEIIAYLKLQKFKNKIPMLHMFFLGNPGTGKTTVARLFGEILSEMKILSNEKIFVEVTRADLIGRHISETEEKTMKMIEKATGGILFIDEAYPLYSDKYSRDYGHNVIDILIREMENRRDKLCVIFAGYTNEMKEFIEMNSGLKSRVNFIIDFENYTNNEQKNIDFENEILIIDSTLSKEIDEVVKENNKNKISIKIGKSSTTKTGRKKRILNEYVYRQIPFYVCNNDELKIILENQIEIAKANEYNKNKILFCNRDGSYITPSQMTALLKRICRELGIKSHLKTGCNIHMTKHTFVTRCIECGISIETISVLVGTSVEKLRKTYIHILEKFKNQEVTNLNKLYEQSNLKYSS